MGVNNGPIGVNATGESLGDNPTAQDIEEEAEYLMDSGIPLSEIEERMVAYYESLDEDKTRVIQKIQHVISCLE